MKTFELKDFIRLVLLCDALFHEWLTFSGQNGLVHYSRAAQQYEIAWNILLLRARYSAQENNIAWIEVISHNLLPFRSSMHPDLLRWLPHASKPLHILQSLHDDSSLKEKQHTQIEQTVVPVLIKQPQQGAKQLEDEEGRHNMFLVQIQKLRYRNVHFVVSPYQVGFTHFLFVLEAFSGLIMLNCFLCWIWNGLEDS